MREKILDCKRDNPTWGYKKIAKHLNCSYSNVRYHLCPHGKEESRARKAKSRKNFNQIIKRKKDTFQFIDGSKRIHLRRGRVASQFSAEQLKNKLIGNPTCYLTGRPIDLLNGKSYHLDHIQPVSKGGDNILNNCGLTCREANMAKGDLTVEDFLKLCSDILKNHGYEVGLAEGRGLAPQTVLPSQPVSSG